MYLIVSCPTQSASGLSCLSVPVKIEVGNNQKIFSVLYMNDVYVVHGGILFWPFTVNKKNCVLEQRWHNSNHVISHVWLLLIVLDHRFRLPSIWFRLAAEVIDICLMFAIKLCLIYFLGGHASLT